DIVRCECSRSGNLIDIENAEILVAEIARFHQPDQRHFPRTPSMDGDALPLEIVDRLRFRIGRYYQKRIAATAAGDDDAGFHTGGIENDRGQIAIAGKIDAAI